MAANQRLVCISNGQSNQYNYLRNYCINSHTVFTKMFRIVLKSYTYRSKQEGFKVVMTLESRILPSLTTTFFIFARSVRTLFNVRAL